jgi:hypothetical protein
MTTSLGPLVVLLGAGETIAVTFFQLLFFLMLATDWRSSAPWLGLLEVTLLPVQTPL